MSTSRYFSNYDGSSVHSASEWQSLSDNSFPNLFSTNPGKNHSPPRLSLAIALALPLRNQEGGPQNKGYTNRRKRVTVMRERRGEDVWVPFPCLHVVRPYCLASVINLSYYLSYYRHITNPYPREIRALLVIPLTQNDIFSFGIREGIHPVRFDPGGGEWSTGPGWENQNWVS